MPASYRKSGSRNTMVTSDVRPEMEIWPFCPGTVKIRNITLVVGTFLSSKNMLYYPYLWQNRLNFCVVNKMEVEEHDGDVKF